MLAITRLPSPRMGRCQRTFIGVEEIDVELAQQQHMEYCQALIQCGADVLMLDADADMPDCSFVEDTAIVLDELAIIASPAIAARRSESAAVTRVLQHYRELRQIEWPATIEGGDVLRVGRTLLVGLSSRTNAPGVQSLIAIARPLGYKVMPIEVNRCLHLKTACSALNENRLLINPDWIDGRKLGSFELVEIPSPEPFAANVARIGGKICLPAAHRRTMDLLHSLDFQIQPIHLSEFAKAEGGTTCLSLVFDPSGPAGAD